MPPPQQSTDAPKDWPILNQKIHLAWGLADELVATSVPLTAEQMAKGLWPDLFYQGLAARVGWMLELADDPEEAMMSLAERLEELGAWTGPTSYQRGWYAAQAMVGHNPSLHTLLEQTFQLPPWGTPLHQMQEAVQEIKDATIWDWMDQALVLVIRFSAE